MGYNPICPFFSPSPLTQCLTKNGPLNGAGINGPKDVKCEQTFRFLDRPSKLLQKRVVTQLIRYDTNIDTDAANQSLSVNRPEEINMVNYYVESGENKC